VLFSSPVFTKGMRPEAGRGEAAFGCRFWLFTPARGSMNSLRSRYAMSNAM
jgi:hypothetical protein